VKTIDPNLYPRDGFFFKESDGSRIGADSWSGVVKRVSAYRKRAGLAAGDPLREVTEQACSRSPVLCVETDAATINQRRIVSLKGRLLKWLAGVRAKRSSEGKLDFVDGDLAKRRADYCAGCPHNTPLPGGCGSCVAALKELRKDILGGRLQDGRVQGCNQLGEDAVVSAHLDLDRVDNPELPAFCWRKIGGG